MSKFSALKALHVTFDDGRTWALDRQNSTKQAAGAPFESSQLRTAGVEGLRGMDAGATYGLHTFDYSPAARTVDIEVTAIGRTGALQFNGLTAALVGALGKAKLCATLQQPPDRTYGVVDGGWAADETSTWWQHIGLTKVDVSKVETRFTVFKITLALLDGAWTYATPNTFEFNGKAAATDGFDHPFDYAFDYGTPNDVSELTFGNSGRWRLWPVIRIAGPATNPAVSIDGNTYQVNCTLKTGETLTVDTLGKTVRSSSGTNLMGAAVLGSGEGSGTYIFQPMPATRGIHRISTQLDHVKITVNEQILGLDF